MENQNYQLQMKDKLKLVTLYLQRDQYKKLKSISKREDVSTSSLIRQSINNYLQTIKTTTK